MAWYYRKFNVLSGCRAYSVHVGTHGNDVQCISFVVTTVLGLGLRLHLDCTHIDSGNLEIEHMGSCITVFSPTLSNIWPLSSEFSLFMVYVCLALAIASLPLPTWTLILQWPTPQNLYILIFRESSEEILPISEWQFCKSC